MMPSTSLERLAAGIVRAQEHWYSRAGDRENAPAFTIAIAREAGALGTSVARAVSERLGWPVYDKELVERIAQDMGLRPALVESVDERRRSWLLEAVEGFTSAPSPSELTYVRRLVQTLLSLGAHGECIIVGRGATLVLPQETTLRVRLVGEPEDRIEATRKRLSLSRGEAQRWVEETDRERVRFGKEHFQKDLRDAALYDLVLNSSRWSIAECADFIIAALRNLQRKASRIERQAVTA
jgi:cytidylate kinase